MKIFKTIWASAFLFIADSVHAAVNVNGSELAGYNLTIQAVFGIITMVACWISRFALIAMVVAIIWYGMRFMIAQGNPKLLESAKKGFWNAIIGIIIIMATYTIIATIGNAFDANYSVIPLSCPSF